MPDMQKLDGFKHPSAPENKIISGRRPLPTSRTSPLSSINVKSGNSERKPGQLGKFKDFKRLPIEIRHEIFILSSRTPRVIELCGYRTKDKKKTTELHMKSNALAPAIMHACVDSRAAGKKIYTPLSFATFTGTYINWSVDWISFKDNTEHLYMKYESNLPASVPNYDLVLKVQRIAVNHGSLNDFFRVKSDDENVAHTKFPEKVFIYPSLETLAVCELWSPHEVETQNLTIVPKSEYPKNLPNSLCPTSPKGKNPDGVHIWWNRYHQNVLWMRLKPGKYQLLTDKRKPVDLKKPVKPKSPLKYAEIARLRVSGIRRIASARGFDGQLKKKDLVSLIVADEEVRHSQKMAEYKRELGKWAEKMLGFTDAPEGEIYGEDVLRARAGLVEKFLAERGFLLV